MAVLDPQLLELIETLAKSRLDWLAFELLEALRSGRPFSESEEALAAARESIQSNFQPKARGEPRAVFSEPQPIEADAQIEWAAAYVERRLDDALAQLKASIDNLASIVAGTVEAAGSRTSAQGISPSEDSGILVVLGSDGDRKSSREDVDDARDGFFALSAALTEWVAQTRGQALS